MSQVNMCDRCKSVDVQVVPVLGFDLCNRCLSEFKTWVKTSVTADGSPRVTVGKRRTPQGQPQRIALQIVAEHGEVSPEAYGRATSKDYRHAYYTLNYLTRCGVLERIRKPGNVIVFVAAVAEAAE